MGQFAAAIPYIVSTGATVAASAYSINQQRASGKMQELQTKQAAKQEGDSARGREIERRKNLLRALATQNASAGAAGAEFSGSIGNQAQVDIEEASNDLLTDNVNTSRQMRALRATGREARRAANADSMTSLIDSANTGYRRLG